MRLLWALVRCSVPGCSCLCRAQVFIQGNAEECGRVLKTILEERRLCPLISPFFTPNAAPDQLVFLYQDVVTSLHLDTADVIFMLLTKVCQNIWRVLQMWWNSTYTQRFPLTVTLTLWSAVWLVPVAERGSPRVFGANPSAGVGPRCSLRLRPRPRAWTPDAFSPFYQTLGLASAPPFSRPLQWLPAAAYDQ